MGFATSSADSAALSSPPAIRRKTTSRPPLSPHAEKFTMQISRNPAGDRIPAAAVNERPENCTASRTHACRRVAQLPTTTATTRVATRGEHTMSCYYIIRRLVVQNRRVGGVAIDVPFTRVRRFGDGKIWRVKFTASLRRAECAVVAAAAAADTFDDIVVCTRQTPSDVSRQPLTRVCVPTRQWRIQWCHRGLAPPPDLFDILFTHNRYFELCDNFIIIIYYIVFNLETIAGNVIAVPGMKTDFN